LVNETAHDLVGRAFSFTDLQARHVMVPRTEVVAVPVGATLDDVIALAGETTYTRLPVYEGDNDHIVGILKIKKLLPLFVRDVVRDAAIRESVPASSNGHGPAPNGSKPHTLKAFDVRDYMTEPMLVPETLPASEVLTQMRENHGQMGVVIDEYGGTAGIVTLQDIVNRLIGKIEEEEHVEELEGVNADGTLSLDGLTGLGELRDVYDVDLESEEYDVETLGGYVFFRLGRPAIVGDEVEGPDGERLRVEELDGLRVARVRVLPAERAAAVAVA
jgi:CBS domain containing-hemolysin-like protein